MNTIKTKHLIMEPMTHEKAEAMQSSSVTVREREYIEAFLDAEKNDAENIVWRTPYLLMMGNKCVGMAGFADVPASGVITVQSFITEEAAKSFEHEALRALCGAAYKTKKVYYVKAQTPASDKTKRTEYVSAKFRLLNEAGGMLTWQAEKGVSLLTAYLLYAGLLIGIGVSYLVELPQLVTIFACAIVGMAIGAVIDAGARKQRKAVTSGASVVQGKADANFALKLMQNNSLSYMPAMEAIRRGTSRIMQAKGTSVLLRETTSGVYMFATEELDQCKKFTEQITEPKCVLAASAPCANIIKEKFGLEREIACIPYCFTRQRHMAVDPDIVMRPLEESDIDTVAGCVDYIPRDYIASRIADGAIFGAYLNGTLIGFGGTHLSGGIGMINVFPAYRRMGYGSSIEGYLINRDFDAGKAPFVHVIRGSDAAQDLQEKLGLETNYKTVVWLF